MSIGIYKLGPGGYFDSCGVPIYPGDLIRLFHFRDRRRRKYYLYHVAVHNKEHDVMELIPACHLEPSKAKSGGRCWMSQDLLDGAQAEVISGHGPGDTLDFTDRKKRKVGSNKK